MTESILVKQVKDFLNVIKYGIIQILPLPVSLLTRGMHQPYTTNIIDCFYQKISHPTITDYGIFGSPIIDERNNIAILYRESKLYLRNDNDVMKYFGISSKIFNHIFHQYGLVIEHDYYESDVVIDGQKICVRFYLSVKYQKHVIEKLHLVSDLTKIESVDLLKAINVAYSHFIQVCKLVSNMNDYWCIHVSFIQIKIQRIYITLKLYLEKRIKTCIPDSKIDPIFLFHSEQTIKVDWQEKMYFDFSSQLISLTHIKHKIPKITLEDKAISKKNILYLPK